eukprot:scaffold4942_cov417-Prasinococcus_capsulatus_cf.AAC.5
MTCSKIRLSDEGLSITKAQAEQGPIVSAPREAYELVIELITGRTHQVIGLQLIDGPGSGRHPKRWSGRLLSQVRVQLAAIGAPLIGDTLYDKATLENIELIERPQLSQVYDSLRTSPTEIYKLHRDVYGVQPKVCISSLVLCVSTGLTMSAHPFLAGPGRGSPTSLAPVLGTFTSI